MIDIIFILTKYTDQQSLEHNKRFLSNLDIIQKVELYDVDDFYNIPFSLLKELSSQYIWIHDPNILIDKSLNLNNLTKKLIVPFTHCESFDSNSAKRFFKGQRPYCHERQTDFSIGLRRSFDIPPRSLIFDKRLIDESSTYNFKHFVKKISQENGVEILWNTCYRLQSLKKVEQEDVLDGVFCNNSNFVSVRHPVDNFAFADDNSLPLLSKHQYVPMLNNVKSDDLGEIADCLLTFGRFFSNYIVYYIPVKGDIETSINNCIKLAKMTDRKFIPAIKITQMLEFPVEPKDYTFDCVGVTEELNYIFDRLYENIDLFYYIMLGNANYHLGYDIGYAAGFEKRFPELASRLIYAPHEPLIDDEAYECRFDLKNAPYRSYALDRSRLTIVLHGFWPLYKSYLDLYFNHKYSQYSYKDINYLVRSHEFRPLQKKLYDKPRDRIFPYTYYSNYIKDLNAFSGMGYMDGAKHRTPARLVKYGYSGVVFYLPYKNPEYFNDILQDCEEWLGFDVNKGGIQY